MLPALVSLKNLVKTKSYHIDLTFFRLHYQVTVCLLLGFCLVLTGKVLFGDIIDCTTRFDKTNRLDDNICFSTGTYTRYQLKEKNPKTQDIVSDSIFKVDPTVPYLYSGILIREGNDDNTKRLWHSYYQYMPVLLFVQAMLFYFPHYLWKMWENGIVSSICKRLYENRIAPSAYLETNYDIIYYLQDCFKANKSLVHKYHCCHVLLLFNMVLQFFALNSIFNGQFVSYGYLVLKYWFIDEDIYGLRANNESYRPGLNNPMDLVFPKLTVCSINSTSQAGNAQNELKLLCVLPLNMLSDKFFLLLWFWFIILGLLTIFQIVKNFLYTAFPYFRTYLFETHYGTRVNPADLSEMFILDLIGNNSDKIAFSALLKKLHKQEEDWTASPSENHSVV